MIRSDFTKRPIKKVTHPLYWQMHKQNLVIASCDIYAKMLATTAIPVTRTCESRNLGERRKTIVFHACLVREVTNFLLASLPWLIP